MDFLSVLYYGVIQGLTEFLPVSSSGHLALLPKFLKISDPGVVFDLAMHVGTAISIICYFHKDILKILKEIPTLLKKDKPRGPQANFTLNLIIATIATFILVLLTKKLAFAYGRTTEMIALNLVIFGLLMWLFDHRGVKQDTSHMMDKVDIKRATWIGIFQAIAIFPGVSRSGSTLTISRAMGLSREESTRFSFLLSLPIIIGGFVFKIPDFFKGNVQFELDVCFYGIFISFIVGLLTIHYFLKFIRKMGLWIFSIYRVILGILIVVLLIN